MPRIYPILQLDKKMTLKLPFPGDPRHDLNPDPGATLLKKLRLSRVLEEMNQMTLVVIVREILLVESLYHLSPVIDIQTLRQVLTQYSALHSLQVRRKKGVTPVSEEDLLVEDPDRWTFHLLPIDDVAIDLVHVQIHGGVHLVAEEAPLDVEEEAVVVGEDRGGPVPPLNLQGHVPGVEIVAVDLLREVHEAEIEIIEEKEDVRLDHLEADPVHQREEVVQAEVKVGQDIEVVVVEVEIDDTLLDLVDQIVGVEIVEEESQGGQLHHLHHHHLH